MKNLAGDKDADKTIIKELTRCGVAMIGVPAHKGEVPYTVEGLLTIPNVGEFKFDRRWYYWAVSGPVPLKLAEELYAMQQFREDIRSGGDCGCRTPSTWATAYKGKQVVVSPEETRKTKEYIAKGSKVYADFAANPEYYLCEDEAEYASYPRVVDTYHIDSELGLYVFVEALKKYTNAVSV